MDYSQPGSSVHGLFQAKILEWISIQGANLDLLHSLSEFWFVNL